MRSAGWCALAADVQAITEDTVVRADVAQGYAGETPAAAWSEKLFERVSALQPFAKRGGVVPEIGQATHRQVFHDPYRIIYQMDTNQVVILTIRHGRREWDPTEG